MAIIDLTIIEGRSQETKDDLIRGLTDVVVTTLGARPEQVRVVIREVRNGAYGVAGKAVYLPAAAPAAPDREAGQG
jgi:4-oxalocrotonate tautomerase